MRKEVLGKGAEAHKKLRHGVEPEASVRISHDAGVRQEQGPEAQIERSPRRQAQQMVRRQQRDLHGPGGCQGTQATNGCKKEAVWLRSSRGVGGVGPKEFSS